MTDEFMRFLAVASDTSLENLELSRLNDAAQLRKEMIPVLDEMIELQAVAKLTRFVREYREELCRIDIRPAIDEFDNPGNIAQPHFAPLPITDRRRSDAKKIG
jgi:hypothetical protein